MIEAEVKYAVDAPGQLRQRLQQLGVRWLGEVVQEDLYFAHPVRNFAQTDEALRLRRQGEQLWLTYKGPKLDPKTKTRQELELPLAGQGEELWACAVEFLQHLGFRPLHHVRKTRRLGELPSELGPIGVAWDEVEDLGPFLELEKTCPEDQAPLLQQTLLQLGQQLGLGPVIRKSYLELLLEKENRA